MDDEPITPRVCEACGGPQAIKDAGRAEACSWCTGGWQDRHQQRAWLRFRSRMRRVSSAYSFLEETVQDVLRRLDTLDTDKAHELTLEGTRLLDARAQASGTDERRASTEQLSAWHQRALDYLIEEGVAYKPLS